MFIRRALALVVAITWMVNPPVLVIAQGAAWKTTIMPAMDHPPSP